MNLNMNLKLAENYTSKSQIARVITEDWFLNNGFCPSCSNGLSGVDNNAKVHDYSCKLCNGQFELKSYLGKTPSKINDGAYDSIRPLQNHSNKKGAYQAKSPFIIDISLYF